MPAGRERLLHSWREGCPVPPEHLRIVRLSFWGFDSISHTGELALHQDQASNVVSVFRRLYDQRFLIEKIELIDAYEGDDDRSVEANNTSGFNCREVEGSPGKWSQHAYGRAVDINPVQNPFVSASGQIESNRGKAYADRSLRRQGMILPDDEVVKAFRSIGWKWGGDWNTSKDYQHFSATGD